jgi:hypothetical protein
MNSRLTRTHFAVLHAMASVLSLTLFTTGCLDDDPMVTPGDPKYKRDPALNVDNRSAPGEVRSHNQGKNCMTCHQQFGPGRGLFTLATTIYDSKGQPAANAVLQLFDRPSADGGMMVAELKGDALGNVFTTDPLPFPNQELFPVVKSADGTQRNAMPFPTISGACNACHRADNRVDLELPR